MREERRRHAFARAIGFVNWEEYIEACSTRAGKTQIRERIAERARAQTAKE